MFDTTDISVKDEQLIELRYSKKYGKPMDDSRQMFLHHVEFSNNGQRCDHDIYDFEERKPGFYLPAFKPKTVYVQEINKTTQEKYITRKPIVILQIGAFVHA